jgi:hypothetical protein
VDPEHVRGWRKSSSSLAPDGNCVEVAADSESVFVRDSKDRDGPILTFTVDAWNAFILAVRSGQFNDPGPRPAQ